jgi:hypothetical protein
VHQTGNESDWVFESLEGNIDHDFSDWNFSGLRHWTQLDANWAQVIQYENQSPKWWRIDIHLSADESLGT